MCEDDSLESSKCEDENNSETEEIKENERKDIYYDKKRTSTVFLESFRLDKYSEMTKLFVVYSLAEAAALERLSSCFEDDLQKAVDLALSVQDYDKRVKLIKVSYVNNN